MRNLAATKHTRDCTALPNVERGSFTTAGGSKVDQGADITRSHQWLVGGWRGAAPWITLRSLRLQLAAVTFYYDD